MATVEELITKVPAYGETVKMCQESPEIVEKVFKPIYDAGIDDFLWVGQGTNAFVVAPVDNLAIVFRVSTESDVRRNDVPFFLASGYERECPHPRGPIKVEMLLSGTREITQGAKEQLLREMKWAGWRLNRITLNDGFWKDVVIVQYRDKNGRQQVVPIVSDPSAFNNYLAEAYPHGQDLGGGRTKPATLNACSPKYMTLEEQAEAYNNVIGRDLRLQKLIPQKVKFMETEIIPFLSCNHVRGE